MRKTLTAIVLSLGLLAGCGKNTKPQYAFNKMVGNERIHFWQDFGDDYHMNYLEITTHDSSKAYEGYAFLKDSTVVTYADETDDDLKIEKIIVKKNFRKNNGHLNWDEQSFEMDDVGTDIIKQGQKLWDGYLTTIKNIKQKEALYDMLKGQGTKTDSLAN